MKYLLLGYTENNMQADPVISFIGSLEEAKAEKEADTQCVRYDFHLIPPPRFRKFVERVEPQPAKKKAGK